jgi:hypothetical protein
MILLSFYGLIVLYNKLYYFITVKFINLCYFPIKTYLGDKMSMQNSNSVKLKYNIVERVLIIGGVVGLGITLTATVVYNNIKPEPTQIVKQYDSTNVVLSNLYSIKNTAMYSHQRALDLDASSNNLSSFLEDSKTSLVSLDSVINQVKSDSAQLRNNSEYQSYIFTRDDARSKTRSFELLGAGLFILGLCASKNYQLRNSKSTKNA